jgi:multiple sugar transport system permease protein
MKVTDIGTIQLRSALKSSKINRNAMLWGFVFISPAILGLMLFNFGPMLFSFIISFFQWDVVSTPAFTGVGNYKLLFKDPLVFHSLRVTLYFTLLAVPLGNAFALFVAVVLNNKRIQFLSVWRTIFYIPSIAPAVASAMLWTFMFNPMFGVLNSVFNMLGMDSQGWIADPNQVIPCMAVMSVWGSGNAVIIYLAGLQGIPEHLYEAVTVDGGNAIHKFVYITLPLLSPIVLYNVLMAMIGNLQSFTQGYLMTNGGPENASLFYVLNLYNTAFKNSQMGFACAQSWLFFLVVSVFTALSFLVSRKVVYYEGKE